MGVVLVLFLQVFGRSYLCPLQVHGIHEGSLKVLDPGVLPFQQTLKLKVRLCSASQVGQKRKRNKTKLTDADWQRGGGGGGKWDRMKSLPQDMIKNTYIIGYNFIF